MIRYLFLFVLISLGCTILKKEDPNQRVLTFLNQFDQSIHQSDSIVLSNFRTHQSAEAILAAIRLLRNPDAEYVDCQINYSQAEIVWETSGPRVTIPVIIHTKGSKTYDQDILLWFEPKGNSFTINRLGAEVFYQNYFRAFNDTRFEKELVEEEKRLKIHFDFARELSNRYDSAVWFTSWNNQSYYYVINGKWDRESPRNPEQFEMGMVDESGKEIIPPKFDLVGTIGIVFPETVEVTQDNKVGYYSITGEELVPPAYDLVIPFITPDTKAIVKTDSIIGWLDAKFTYHPGYPWPEAEDYFNDFRFLDAPIRYGRDTQPLCHAFDWEMISTGTLLPPTYLVKYGIFDSVVKDFVTNLHGMPGYTDYVQKESFDTFSLTEKLKIVITNFKSRFLDGREEFYFTNNLILVNQNLDTLGTSNLWGESIQLKKVDSLLIEAKLTHNSWEPDESGAFDFPNYKYYQVFKDKLIRLESERYYDMSEFVKLDSSYFKGPFRFWDFASNQEVEEMFMPSSFFESMRNEILASYGYIFKDPETINRFSVYNWYDPRYSSFDEIIEIATEIDKHNLKFIERIIGPVNAEVI